MCMKPSNNSVDDDEKTTEELVLDLVVANRENTAKVGWFIGEHQEKSEVSSLTTSSNNNNNKVQEVKKLDEIDIPFYSTVREGANFDGADWKDQACVRQAVISWRDDLSVQWLERHMEMTQGFICVGNKAPGLLVLGEPTHDRDDLDDDAKSKPDLTRVKAYIVPPGCGIVIKKGVWHDFPASCGPPLTAFIINTEEVIEALTSMKEPGPMDHGDCYKLHLPDIFPQLNISFPDPRPFVKEQGLVRTTTTRRMNQMPPMPGSVFKMNEEGKTVRPSSLLGSIATMEETNGFEGYGYGMVRSEVDPSWGLKDNGFSSSSSSSSSAAVYVVPVVNVEVFLPGKGGPSIQPHLQSKPELANKGWRDSGNKNGLSRLVSILKKLDIPATAVINSDAVRNNPDIASMLGEAHAEAGWELAGHGKNNSTGFASYSNSKEDEEWAVEECLYDLKDTLQMTKKPTSWLTPGFSVTGNTPDILASAGIECLLDFVDDEIPYRISSVESGSETICIPYSMETNDFSLVLGRHLSPRDYAEAIESHIEQLADEAKESGMPKVVCIGMHTFVAGQPGYARELGKAMGRLQKYDDDAAGGGSVRFTTAEAIVGAIKKNSGLPQ